MSDAGVPRVSMPAVASPIDTHVGSCVQAASGGTCTCLPRANAGFRADVASVVFLRSRFYLHPCCGGAPQRPWAMAADDKRQHIFSRRGNGRSDPVLRILWPWWQHQPPTGQRRR